MPAPECWSLAIHLEEIWYVLIDLFENPIADADSESRELSPAVLGNSVLEFAKPIFYLADNPHLRDGDRSVPWSGQVYRPAYQLLHEKGSRFVLTIAPAATKGQEFLFDLLGNYTYNVYTQYVQRLAFLSLVYARYVIFMSYKLIS